MSQPFMQEYTANIFLLGLMIYREAAGEPRDGKVAVGYTVMTRAEHPRWWGEDPYSVITKPEQYSSMTHLGDPMTVKFPPLTDSVFLQCIQIAEDVFLRGIPNPVPGADHYCTAAVAARTKWVDESKFLKQIGNHRFYNLDGDPAEEDAA